MKKCLIVTCAAATVGVISIWLCDSLLVVRIAASMWAATSVLNAIASLRWSALTIKYDQLTTDMLKTFYEMRDRHSGNQGS